MADERYIVAGSATIASLRGASSEEARGRSLRRPPGRSCVTRPKVSGALRRVDELRSGATMHRPSRDGGVLRRRRVRVVDDGVARRRRTRCDVTSMSGAERRTRLSRRGSDVVRSTTEGPSLRMLELHDGEARRAVQHTELWRRRRRLTNVLSEAMVVRRQTSTSMRSVERCADQRSSTHDDGHQKRYDDERRCGVEIGRAHV